PHISCPPCWQNPLRMFGSLGERMGLPVEGKDHIWIIHRQGSLEMGELHPTTNPPIAMCCAPAPPVLQFDQEGNLVGHFGGKAEGYDCPDSNHGVTVDYKGNVWIGVIALWQPPGA